MRLARWCVKPLPSAQRRTRTHSPSSGAQRILRQSFQPQLSRLLDGITGLNAFGALVRKAFAERAAADADAFAELGRAAYFAPVLSAAAEPAARRNHRFKCVWRVGA